MSSHDDIPLKIFETTIVDEPEKEDGEGVDDKVKRHDKKSKKKDKKKKDKNKKHKKSKDKKRDKKLKDKKMLANP